MSQNLVPPTGDLYDIGLLVDRKTDDANVEPYKTQRGIVKEVFNVLTNDESGSSRLCTKKVKQIGLSFGKLKKLILKRHPPLKAGLGKGITCLPNQGQVVGVLFLLFCIRG
jgi:hypothetical protein